MTLPHSAPVQPNHGIRALDRDDETCLHAYQQELDYLLRTLKRLGVGPVDIEDLAQDVFLILRCNWQHYDPRRPLRPYLFAIPFRVASSHRRRRLREVPVAVVNGPDLALCSDALLEANQARNVVLLSLIHI